MESGYFLTSELSLHPRGGGRDEGGGWRGTGRILNGLRPLRAYFIWKIKFPLNWATHQAPSPSTTPSFFTTNKKPHENNESDLVGKTALSREKNLYFFFIIKCPLFFQYKDHSLELLFLSWDFIFENVQLKRKVLTMDPSQYFFKSLHLLY